MQMLASGACIMYNQNAGGCNRMLKVLLHGSLFGRLRILLCPAPTGSWLAFAPRELAAMFLALNQKNLAGGLFLTSGIPYDTDDVMGELIETARILRERGIPRDLHLKILPVGPGGYPRGGAVRGPDEPQCRDNRGEPRSVTSPGSKTIPVRS